MNASGYTNTSDTKPWMFAAYWERTFDALDVVIITLLAVTFWLWVSFIIYGTKANRWRNKPGNSSLSSGTSYILCAISIFVRIPFLAMLEVINQHPDLLPDRDICRALADGAATAYFLSLYTTYLFLWFMQRRCYKHPYLQGRVNSKMDVFSVTYAIFLTVSFAGIVGIYNAFGRYRAADGMCVYNSPKTEKLLINLCGVAVIGVMQIALICTSIYTAVRARFPTNPSDQNSSPNSDSNNWKIFYRWFFPKNSKVYFGPIEKTVRRLIAFSLIIIIIDIIVIAYDIILPIEFPLSLHLIGYGISSTIDVFCMVSIFGFSEKVLSLCCPKKMHYEKPNRAPLSSVQSE